MKATILVGDVRRRLLELPDSSVALRHGRNFIGTELNPNYAQIAHDRITNDQPMLNEREIL